MNSRLQHKSIFRGHGKLLLSGEYFVLDGAKALAVPTRFGQTMTVAKTLDKAALLDWKSLDSEGNIWLHCQINLDKMLLKQSNDIAVGERLLQIFQTLTALNPLFFEQKNSFTIQTALEFPRDWGLGSSSTLIYCLSQWANVNPYELLAQTMGGSGYDIACAGTNQAIIFERKNKIPTYELVNFNPPFAENLYFVYLGKKQNSREGIARYRERIGQNHAALQEISELSTAILDCKNLLAFENLLTTHEKIIGSFLDLPLVKNLYFDDYEGVVKSLGAWGGDFVLATSRADRESTASYFYQKGFGTVLSYCEMVLGKEPF